MKRTKDKIEVSNPDQPPPFMFANRNPKYRKANSEFVLRKFRMEFDKLTIVRPLCKRTPLPIPTKLLKYPRRKPKIDSRKKRKRSKFIFYY